MKQALFARTDNLNEVVEQLRAREGGAMDILGSQITARLVHVLCGRGRARAELAAALASDFVGGLGHPETGGAPDLERLWGALEAAESGSARAGRRDRAIERHLTKSFAHLRAHDPAAHHRLADLLHGRFERRTADGFCDDDGSSRLGARGVLARTVPPGTGRHRGDRDDVRELLRWREILVSLLPEEHRPIRRMIMPGGLTCADPEGPRLSWLRIAGGGGPGEEGAFEAHVISCDHCFEFHYRTRHAIRVLAQKKSTLTETQARERTLTRFLRDRYAAMLRRETARVRGA